MTQEEFNALSDTERAFLKLEGRCAGCGCGLKDRYWPYAPWCSIAPHIIFNLGHEWAKHSDRPVIQTSRRQGKRVFANTINELNKLFGKQNENTNC